MSERIRLALERHEYAMHRTNLVGTIKTIETYIDILEAALRDFTFSDFKVACRAMPSLIEGYLEEEPHSLSTKDAKELVEWMREADPRERIYMLDAAIKQRS